MKALLAAFLLVSFAAGTLHGQAGSIGIFADPQGLNCDLADTPPAGLKMYYVVHVYTTGATAAQFSAPKPHCMTGTWLSDTNVFPVVVGNTQTGISVGYGACKVSPIHVLTMNFFAMGTTPSCCLYWACPDPYNPSHQIEVSDCSFFVRYATGGVGVINATPVCSCSWCASPECVEALYRTSSNCWSVPVEEMTWGRIKTLYAE